MTVEEAKTLSHNQERDIHPLLEVEMPTDTTLTRTKTGRPESFSDEELEKAENIRLIQ